MSAIYVSAKIFSCTLLIFTFWQHTYFAFLRIFSYLYFEIELVVAQRQSRQEDMNRLALACVTAVTLAGGVVFGGVAGMTEDDAALSDVAVDEMMYTLDGEVENVDDVGIGLENDTRFSLLVSIFELYDVHPLKTYNFGKNMNMSVLNILIG